MGLGVGAGVGLGEGVGVAAGFGQIALDLLVNVEGTLDGLADYLNADNEEQREAALQKIRTNLEQFFTKLAAIVTECLKILNGVGKELQESDDPVTRAIGDILVGLTNALQWLIDNQEAVKAAFEAIFGVWLLGKLAAVAGQLAGILASIKTIQLFSLVNGAGAGASAAGAGASAAGNAAIGAGAGAGGAAGGEAVHAAVAGGALKDTLMWGLGPMALVLGAGIAPAVIAQNADVARRHAELEQTRETAAAAWAAMGARGDNAMQAVLEASGAMDITGRKNVFGQDIMGGPADVEKALAEVLQLSDTAGERFLSNRTRLMMRYTGTAGMDALSQYGLLDTAMQEAADFLQNGGPAEDTRDPSAVLEDAMDSIDALRETDDKTGEAMYSLIDTIVDDPALTGQLSDKMLDRLGEYLDPNSGFGVGSATRHTDAQQLLTELYTEMDAVFWAGHPVEGSAESLPPEAEPGMTPERGNRRSVRPIPGEFETLKENTRPEDVIHPRPGEGEDGFVSNRTALLMRYNSIAGMTDMQQSELYSDAMKEMSETAGLLAYASEDVTGTLSDAMDAIVEVQETDDLTGEAMYRLIDRIIDNPTITGQLSPEMLTRLGEYLDPNSGFGVGSATRYTDSQQLLDELYAEMDAAFWAAAENGPAGGEILNRLDQLVDVETERRDAWHDPQGAMLRTLDADIWKNGGSGSGSDGLNGADLQRFLGLPAQISAAVRSGAATGVSGIRVTLDGYTVGRLVAPYVSQEIARDLP